MVIHMVRTHLGRLITGFITGTGFDPRSNPPAEGEVVLEVRQNRHDAHIADVTWIDAVGIRLFGTIVVRSH
jgi:hypothetical protein